MYFLAPDFCYFILAASIIILFKINASFKIELSCCDLEKYD